MSRHPRPLLASLSLIFVAGCGSKPARLPPPSGPPPVAWAIQSSVEAPESGEILSRPDYAPRGWYSARVPSTVVGTLVDGGLFGDPFLGTNWRSIPGTDYPIGGSFAYFPLSAQSPFVVPWWYRTPLPVPALSAGRHVWLRFGGINDRASIFLNGHKLADEKDVVGMFRAFEFDVTGLVQPGGANALAVAVRAPAVTSLSMSWVDWAPSPPDRDMGLWRPVSVITTGPVRLRYPSARAALEVPALDRAHVTVSADLENAADSVTTGVLEGTIDDGDGGLTGAAPIHFQQPVTLQPHGKATVTLSPDQFSSLNIASPRLWWPRSLGPQNLYTLALRFTTGGTVSDEATAHFGVRDVRSEITAEGYRLFRVNGHPLLIRGAGFAPDVMLRDSPRRLEDEMRYVAEIGLNALRLEGKVGSEELYDLADRYGILILAGWCCCEQWEWWDRWTDENRVVAAESLAEQIRLLRNHPSALAWLNGSDLPPPPPIQQLYLIVLETLDWRNPVLAASNATDAAPLGPTGVKMPGPYLWVPPNYWYQDSDQGGAFGFNTETSPGAAIPPLQSLKKFIPADHLWPVDSVWTFHAGGATFADLGVYTGALAARYGASDGVEDFARVSQLSAYEAERAMFEAYGRNKYRATGVIQWMLDNAWPSVIWHLFDYYLVPGGGYFGAKKALEPIHVQYSYDDRSIVAVNSTLAPQPGLIAEARVFDSDSKLVRSYMQNFDLAADGVMSLFTIDRPAADSRGLFLVDLTLRSAQGARTLSRNFYWLSTQPDVLAFDQSTWFYTPVSSFADLSGLRSLPTATVAATAARAVDGDDTLYTVTMTNTSDRLAMFIHAVISSGAGGDEIAPVRWDDNDVALLPHESRILTARLRTSDVAGAGPAVRMEGWNVATQLVPLSGP